MFCDVCGYTASLEAATVASWNAVDSGAGFSFSKESIITCQFQHRFYGFSVWYSFLK
jgi:hypothetical protein